MKEINRIFIRFLDNWPCKDSSQFFVAYVQLNLKKKENYIFLADAQKYSIKT